MNQLEHDLAKKLTIDIKEQCSRYMLLADIADVSKNIQLRTILGCLTYVLFSLEKLGEVKDLDKSMEAVRKLIQSEDLSNQ